MALNLTFFYGFIRGADLIAGDLSSLFHQPLDALPAVVGLAMVGIINAQLPVSAKFRVVFMRWKNPLPGSKAFSHFANIDERIDKRYLEKAFGPFPIEPAEQNALWYRLYKSIDREPAVLHAHKSFLFARDYTCLALLMLVFLGFPGFFQISELKFAIIYFAILLIQFILAGQAARNHAKRLVTTVLAIKSAKR